MHRPQDLLTQVSSGMPVTRAPRFLTSDMNFFIKPIIYQSCEKVNFIEKSNIVVLFIQSTDLRDFFIAQLKLKRESLGEVSEDDIELTEELVEEDKVEAKEISLEIKFTEKVLRYITTIYLHVDYT